MPDKTITKDLFGVLCRKYFENKREAELKLELDNGVIMDDFPVSFYVDTTELRELERKFLEKANGRVLDIGCGPGRISSILKQKGLDVVGVDKSEHMVHIAKQRGLKTYQMDVNWALPQERFDTFIMYGNGFGMPGCFYNIRNLLSRLHSVSKPNAVVIAESNDPNRMTNQIDLDYQAANLRNGSYIGNRIWRSVSGVKAGEWEEWVQVEPSALEEIAKSSGWKISSDPAYEQGSQWGAYFFALSKK